VVLNGFVAAEGPVVLEGFVVAEGPVVLKGFVAVEGPAVLIGLIGTGAFQLACTLPFARFAHVLPQYGCTMAPSAYLGLFLQCLGG